MKNTLLPLSVAFVADDGSIVNIEGMKPQTLDSHCSTRPVRYVLEMNEGWFAKRGIKAGSKVNFEIAEDGRAFLRKIGKGRTQPNRFERMRGTATSGLTTEQIMALTRGQSDDVG